MLKKSYLELLENSFPGIESAILRYETLGFLWEEGRLFLKENKGEILSHIHFFE